MPNDKYWQERMEALEDANHQKGRAYTANVEKQFRMAQKNIEDKINYWYARMAENNEITMQGAKRLLRADELEEFKWSVEEYIKKGESLQYSDKWAKQLENASAKVHISRLEALKMQMQQECEVLYGNMADGLDDTLRDMYTNSYYHTAYEMMKGHGVGWAFNRLDDRRIETAINTLWTNDGKRFSDRVWSNKDKLVNELNTVLTQNIIRGESPQRAIQQLSHRLKVSRSNAGRLIMTESAFIHSQAQRDCYKELDVERFQFVATLDSRTSEVCQAMDGVIIDMTDYKIGLNVPPLHCYCRSCVIPYYEDNVGMRAARGEDGKTYLVPSDMTYKDWKKSFVDGDVSDLETIDSGLNGFTKAQTIEEVQDRISKASGGAKVDLSDMDIRVANDYLQGVEEFYAEYPELKGYIKSFNTGRNNIASSAEFEVRWNNDKARFRPEANIHFANESFDDYMKSINENIESGFKYEGSNGVTTAKHELTHALQTKMYYMEKGLYADGQFVEQNIFSFKASKYEYISDSNKIINKAIKNVYGKESYLDDIKYLGDYAKQDRNELIAQAVSYEMSGKTHPFSAEVKRIFDEKYEKMFGAKLNKLDDSVKSDIIKLKNSELPNGLPIKGEPNSIVDKVDDTGKTLQRRKHGSDGMAIVDYDTSDHNQPKAHPTGAHKHEFDYSKKSPRQKPQPLTEEELKENEDIIKKGVNYHDEE